MATFGGTRYNVSRPRRWSPFEQWALLIGVIVLCLGVAGFVIDFRSRKNIQPLVGGTYTEGVVADSPTKVDRIVGRLTNIGLTYIDADGSIKPGLVSGWEVTEEGKVYTFTLKDGYDQGLVLSIIQNAKTQWSGVTVEAEGDNKIRFRLPEPFSLFLSTTTAPLFPFGPYEVVKRDEKEVVFRANEKSPVEPAYIPKIILRTYDSSEALFKGVQDGEILGSADFDPLPPRSFKEYASDLPRYYVLVPNLTKPNLKKLEERQRVLVPNDGAPVSYSLVTAQTSAMSDLAERLKNEAATKNITLDVQRKNTVSLQKEDIPNRNFDFLLYGIDLGVDPDYYPFWHSSQVAAPGLNVSGVKDKELDSLLEKARRESDTAKRAEYTKQIETMLTQKGLQKIVSQEKAKFWMSASIQGVEYGKLDEGIDRFNLVWRWFIKSKKVK